MNAQLSDTALFPNFETAARTTLAFLHQHLGFNLWMVTRTEGDDWIVLQAEDHGYGVEEGAVFRWDDSFCSRMVQGHGPRIAPSSAEVPVYAAAPISRQVSIGAYIGVPLVHEDGCLFGTLCAIDPNPQPDRIMNDLPLVELVAKLLCTLLASDLRASEEARRAERAEAEALSDALTGLYNRRGWDRLMAAEESRCLRYGHPACVVSLDLDDLKEINDTQGHAAGDQLIVTAAEAVQETVRSPDVAARVGGDEFSILAMECDQEGVASLVGRLRIALEAAEVDASIGFAARHPSKGLGHAWQQADEVMYDAKRGKKTSPQEIC